MILNRYERLIARRYLSPGKGEGERFIFLVSMISLAAVALGVAALIIVMSVMNGFRAELFEKTAGLNGHAVLVGYDGRLPNWEAVADQARKVPGVISALPLIEQPLMVSANGRVEGVFFRGMRVGDIRANSVLTGGVKSGDLKLLQPGCDCVAIGVGLARNLGAYPGSEISLISPEGRSTAIGTVPRIVSYRVVATFEVGVYDLDNAYVITPMQDAQTYLMMGDEVGLIEVKVAEPDRVEDQMGGLSRIMNGRGQATDWRSMNAAIFEALEVERVAMFVVLSLIILVAVFNILSSLIMLVRAKTRDIAILRTMGASRKGMMKIFVTVGTTIGALGILFGLALGALFLFFRQPIVDAIQWLTGQNLWDPSVRFLSELPSKTDPVEVAVIVVTAFVLSFLATLYPAWKAASTDPVQVLRYE